MQRCILPVKGRKHKSSLKITKIIDRKQHVLNAKYIIIHFAIFKSELPWLYLTPMLYIGSKDKHACHISISKQFCFPSTVLQMHFIPLFYVGFPMLFSYFFFHQNQQYEFAKVLKMHAIRKGEADDGIMREGKLKPL